MIRVAKRDAAKKSLTILLLHAILVWLQFKNTVLMYTT